MLGIEDWQYAGRVVKYPINYPASFLFVLSLEINLHSFYVVSSIPMKHSTMCLILIDGGVFAISYI